MPDNKIPKVAHFFWFDETAMPPLRQASVDSFKRFNPDWQVFVHHSPEQGDVSLRRKIIRSDAARYGILSRSGGVYFDTDIVFIKPIPSVMLESDLALPILNRQLYGVHVLGSSPGTEFFKKAVNIARYRLESNRQLNAQSLGIKLWETEDVMEMTGKMGLSVFRIPVEWFLSVGCQDSELLWSKCEAIAHEAIGLHWYGGDLLSKEYEYLPINQLPDCPVRSAIMESLS